MSVGTANLVNRWLSSLSSNPITTLQRRIYHYVGAIMPVSHLRLALLSASVFEIEYDAEALQ